MQSQLVPSASGIVHIGALAELALFFFFFFLKRILANGTICRILSLKRWKRKAVPFGPRERNAGFYSKCLKTSCAFGLEVIGFANQGSQQSF